MKNRLGSIFVSVMLLFGSAVPANAWPLLSGDGSLLSGLDVGGVLYDVHFGDAIPIGSNLLDPDWYQFAPDLNLALANALNGLGAVGSDISGCQSNECTLFIADTMFIDPHIGYAYYDRSPAIFDGQVWGVSSVQASLYSDSFGPLQPDPAATPTLTVASVTPSVAVPVPATISLIALGIAALAFGFRRRELSGY